MFNRFKKQNMFEIYSYFGLSTHLPASNIFKKVTQLLVLLKVQLASCCRSYLVIISALSLLVLVGCQSNRSNDDIPTQQAKPDLRINDKQFMSQISEIKRTSPKLLAQHQLVYARAQAWANAGGKESELAEFGLKKSPLFSANQNKVLFTGYYTPILKARHTKQGEFIYPLYRQPGKIKGGMPSREAIYNGALANQNLEIAYTNTLIGNFIMGVQGSGYVDFEDGNPPVYFAYGGQNGHKFKGIGKVLVERGEVSQEDISLQAIIDWVESHTKEEVHELLIQNPSWVFFKPTGPQKVKGAAGVPLVAEAAIAADRNYLPSGGLVFAKVPHIDAKGNPTHFFIPRLLVGLDVGGAIKDNHFDLYHGAGEQAGKKAGYHKYEGEAWQLLACEQVPCKI